ASLQAFASADIGSRDGEEGKAGGYKDEIGHRISFGGPRIARRPQSCDCWRATQAPPQLTCRVHQEGPQQRHLHECPFSPRRKAVEGALSFRKEGCALFNRVFVRSALA